VAPLTTLKVIAVVYSYIPYAVGLQSSISFFRYRGTRQLWKLLWAWSMMPLQELVFKKLVREPRPGSMLQVRDYSGRYVGSCLQKCGMPSSHANLTIGWLTLLLLDAVYRVRPFALGRKTQTMHIRPDASGIQKYAKCMQLYLTVPWEHRDLLTHTEFLVFMSTWVILLSPVPFMRVVLYDHTFEQVSIGSIIGIMTSVAWWRVVRRFQRRYHEQEGQRVFFDLLEHNHKLTQFHITTSGDIDSELPAIIGISGGSSP
jgi:membrane-associated phospholipid phosphatase